MNLCEGKEKGISLDQPVVNAEYHQLLTCNLDSLSLSQDATTHPLGLNLLPIQQ